METVLKSLSVDRRCSRFLGNSHLCRSPISSLAFLAVDSIGMLIIYLEEDLPDQKTLDITYQTLRWGGKHWNIQTDWKGVCQTPRGFREALIASRKECSSTLASLALLVNVFLQEESDCSRGRLFALVLSRKILRKNSRTERYMTLWRSVQLVKHWKDCPDACFSLLFPFCIIGSLQRWTASPSTQLLKQPRSWFWMQATRGCEWKQKLPCSSCCMCTGGLPCWISV